MIRIMSVNFISYLAAHAEDTLSLEPLKPLFCAGDPVVSLFIVISGEVALERLSEAGTRLIIQRAKAGDLLAEASAFAAHYHCYAHALRTSIAKRLSMRRFQAICIQDPTLLTAMAHHLAVQLQAARMQTEILSLRVVAMRLDAWLVANNGTLPPRGEWRDLADMLAVTPEALYRELAGRRRMAITW